VTDRSTSSRWTERFVRSQVAPVSPSALGENARAAPSVWLFSRRTDLWVFVGPAVASLLLVAVGLWTGAARGDTPPLLWLLAVLCVDVSHVWSTVYRVYTDKVELKRRPLLYFGAPVGLFALGVVLHLIGPLVFWRVLAYAAVFHFVRQQYGWIRLYRKRAQETDRLGGFVDGAAIYLATLYPLIFWHASEPRHFTWFVPGDFVLGVLPRWSAKVALGAYLLALAAYGLKALWQLRTGAPVLWGKHALVLTTALCWYVGIVALDSDFVFTVTNVLIHGVPYFALVWRYGERRYTPERTWTGALFRRGWPWFYGTLVLLALAEEGLWDKLVWHDHPQFFGAWGVALPPLLLAGVVSLLAVPQATHYFLDGFVWRGGKQNPGLREHLGL